MSKILLTNGAYKQTLAIARSLGAAGYEVGIVSHHAFSVGFFSKYCRHRHIIREINNGQKYTQQLIFLLKKHHYDIVLPVGYPVTGWLAERADAIRLFSKLPLAHISAFNIFEDKQKTHDLARQLGIPIPLTFAPKTLEEATKCFNLLELPVVFKKIMEGKNRIAYAYNEDDYFRFFKEFNASTPEGVNEGFIIQEFLTGQGAGYFALYENGILKQDFMHLRLREYPVDGGAACFAQSIDNEQLRTFGSCILTTVQWHGVAMVEFKFDAKGEPRLLEVNPKFWGSYDLCLAANADFAVPLVEMALGKTLSAPPQYKRNLRFSWLMNGDLLNGIERGKVREVLSDFFSSQTHSNLIWRDPLASLFLILSGILSIFKAILRRIK